MSEQKVTKKSDLRLIKNILSLSIFEINSNINFSEWIKSNELQIKLESTFELKKDDYSSARLNLTLEVFNRDFKEKELPFHMIVKMKFLFKDIVGEYDIENNVVEKFNLNMVSISYPYLRSYIATLSAISGIEQIHIPVINVYDTLVDSSEEEPSI